jgi:hypothetical protein
MATVTPGMTGAVIDSGAVANTVALRSGRGGSLLNKGAATVYIGWNGVTVAADDTAELNKAYLAANEAVRIPSGADSFTHKTAVGTAKLVFLEA